MTRIKICGLTNNEDARVAVDAGADALGFIAVPNTPRYVSPDDARSAMLGLPPFVTRVIVVKNPLESVGYPADTLQYYANDAALPAKNFRRIRVFRIRDETSLNEIAEYRFTPDAILLDAYHESALGGAGVTFDWKLALHAKEMLGDLPIILAGGLTPDNVAEAVLSVRPYAVDVSSGVEAEPGRKDHDKVRRFIAAVRQIDLSQ